MMEIDFRYVFFILWAISLFSLLWFQVVARPIPIHRKWNWRNPHEKLMVSTFLFWIMIFVSKHFNWIISL